MKGILLAILLLCQVTLFATVRTRHLTVADGLQSNQVCQLVELPGGQLLVGTEWMFNLYNGKEFVLQECNLDSLYPLPTFGFHSHLWQGDSLLWLKDFHWLYLYDAHNRSFRYDYTERIKDPQISSFIHEQGDSLTKAHVMNLKDKRSLLNSLTQNTPLHGQWLTAYLRDRQGGQWLGMQNAGILYVYPSVPQATHFFIPRDEEVRRMAMINDTLLLTATSKGLHIYDINQKRILQTLVQEDFTPNDIAKDSNGHIWISTQQGLYCYKDGHFKHYTTTNVDGFLHNQIRFTYPLPDGRLLLCNLLHHLGYFYPEEKRFELLTEIQPQLKQYRAISAVGNTHLANQLAVCTQNGAFLFDTSNNTIRTYPALSDMSKYSQKYNCILFDSSRRLWIGTSNGLLMLTGNGRSTRLTQAEGLSNTSIRSIVEDLSGNLWVGTSHGINRVNVEENGAVNILSLKESDGIPSCELTERGAVAMPDGRVCFASNGGIVSLRPDEFNSTTTTLPVILTGAEVCDNKMPTDTLPLHLNHRQNYFHLQFSALNYASPNQTRYRYRLQGIDEDWIYDYTGNGLATAQYNALSPGHYIFQAQAAVGTGTWGPTLNKVIVIHPPLWLTWWAKSIYVLLLLAASYLLVSIYLKRHRAKLERDNDEKVNRLFEIRSEARHQFAHSTNIEPEKIAADKEEEALIQHILDAIEQNMANTDYTVDQLAKDIGMSRANLYKKTQTMLGITPNDFLRNVRLKHAAHLLAETDHTVSQIALMVGFLTPRYFSQCFKKMFGVLPSEYGGRISGVK